MKRFYRFLTFSLFWLPIAVAQAQEEPTSFTLEQAIDYALKNSISLQNATIDQQIASAKVKETIGLGLPQVSGSATVQHNEQLRRFFGRYSTTPGSFSFFPVTPGANDGDVLAAQNFFQLKSSGDVGLNINQLIFSGSYFVGLQASNTYKELSVKTANQTKEQVIEQVTKAYYNVLINEERAALFDNNIARIDSLLKSTRALNKNGFAEDIDVDRVQVAYNNIRSERDKFVNLKKLGLELLKFQMSYPVAQPITVTGKIEDVQVSVETNQYLQNWDYKTRSDYQVLETNYKLQKLNIKNLYAGSLPTISAFANLGYFTQSNDIGGIFKTNTGISDNGQLGPDKWYGYSLFGVSMSMNIFTGFQRHFKVQQEKLTLQKVDNGFKTLQQAINLETKQASINFDNAIATLASQKENMELATKVAKVTKIKYEQGVGSNLEVVDAENSLRTAQTNYYNALFDAIVAKVDIDKAFGKILTNQNTQK